MHQTLVTQVQTLLDGLSDPHTQKPPLAQCINAESTASGRLLVELQLGYPALSYEDELKRNLTSALRTSDLASSDGVEISVSSQIEPRSVRGQVKPLANVKNLIAVASGKGGVGKSTISTALAQALSLEGARVGILDADIYGPSQPLMLGVKEKPDATEQNQLMPIEKNGIQSMSIGYLIDDNTAMIWRGPMVTQALEQLLRHTKWDRLDYLILDLPPGTGDIQLTIAQRVPVTASVLITTPQNAALIDVRRAQKMFAKTEIPVIGIIENMAGYACKHCGEVSHLFGDGGGEKLAKEMDIPLLGSLPLSESLCQYLDAGDSLFEKEPDSVHAKTLIQIARRMTARLALRPTDSRGLFPDIVISDD